MIKSMRNFPASGFKLRFYKPVKHFRTYHMAEITLSNITRHAAINCRPIGIPGIDGLKNRIDIIVKPVPYFMKFPYQP